MLSGVRCGVKWYRLLPYPEASYRNEYLAKCGKLVYNLFSACLPWWRCREAQGSRITLAPYARDELRGARGVYVEERGILLYSDGLVEAHDSKGEMFGFPRLRALIAEHGENRLLGVLLLDELNSFVAEGWEDEDVTLLTLEHFPIRS